MWAAVWAVLRPLLGDVTAGELALVAILFAAIVLFSWAPKAGEWIGGWFDDPS